MTGWACPPPRDREGGNWVTSAIVTVVLTFVATFCFCRYDEVSAERSFYLAMALSCLSLTAHRLILVAKRFG